MHLVAAAVAVAVAAAAAAAAAAAVAMGGIQQEVQMVEEMQMPPEEESVAEPKGDARSR